MKREESQRKERRNEKERIMEREERRNEKGRIGE